MDETKKSKATMAQMRATQKYEKKAYFRTMVRFKKEYEEIIREKAGDSLNGFIVRAVLEKIGILEDGE